MPRTRCLSRILLALALPLTANAGDDWVSQWSNHFQLTTVTQTHAEFHSPYQGPNSLNPKHEIPSSVTSTLFIGHRLWRDAALFMNPEESIGSGFSGTHGIAGFPNAEIYRVDDPTPKTNLSRLFIQQDFGLGGGTEQLEDDQNRFAGPCDRDRLTIVAGKFSLNDYFDDNAYSHDPRTQFLGWALMDDAAWDYAADTRGYTWGIYVELKRRAWSLRFASVEEPVVANQLDMNGDIAHFRSDNAELEYRYEALGGHPGKARLLGFLNHAHMGSYRDALNLASAAGKIPDVTQTERLRTKPGVGLNLEQELTPELGVFSRLGWDDGSTETWAFTEVERAFSLGASLKGASWRRPDDVVGLAFMLNGISKDHADYLAAGGQGFVLGDGALNYAPEQILESYYLFKLTRELGLTGDFQFVNHPGYNADRGPVPIFSIRLHCEI